MMENAEEDHFAKLRNYLSNLLNSDNITKLQFVNFDLKCHSEWNNSFSTITNIIEKLLTKNEKNLSLCVDLLRALFMVVSHKWPNIAENFILSEIDENCEWLKPLMDRLGEKYDTILFFGMLAYVTTSQYSFSNEKCHYMIDQRMIHEIQRLLGKAKYIDVLLNATDSWAMLLLENMVQRNNETTVDILKSQTSVIIAFWNHRCSVQRSCVERLILKSLSFDYARMEKGGNSVVNTRIFKYMMDISWKIPFKYFLCLHLLKFAISKNEMSQIINVIKEELSHGFEKILQNRNAVGVEMELFTYCLNNFAYQDWNDIVRPIAYSALLKKSSGCNLAKWWLPQISKKYPLFVESFYQTLFEHVDKEAYPRVLVTTLKICYSRKVGLPCIEGEETFLNYLNSLFSLPEEIRGDLFALVCELHDQSVLHSEQELSSVMIFLKCNVNSNCTLLRHVMLSSFSKFVLRLFCSCVRIIKQSDPKTDKKAIPAVKFLKDLNDFIADGIRPGCSYQRKITSLNLYKILMTYGVRDCGGSIHRNNLKDAGKLVDFAKKNNFWNFESGENRKLLFDCLVNSCEEVQNLASILLRNYFRLDNAQLEIFEEALTMLNDNQFYMRSCGVSTIVSLISMAYSSYNKLCVRMYIEYTSFLEFFSQLLENKIEIMMKDVLETAVNHPLDADIKVLKFLITNPTSPEFEYVTNEQIERLIMNLEVIVPLLLKALSLDKSSDYAPSFEESDLALRKLIKTSRLSERFASANDDEQCQLQPLYQLLLNFIWITLKVCSELESDLIANRTDLLNEDQIIRCCNLITSKLILCRHKGLLEAAGAALSNVVRVLTTRNICLDWLESTVMDVIHLIEFKSGATISRKSGGLSFLIQNMVASDRRPNKPLIGKCWIEFKRILSVDYESIKANITEEIPQTHALHLLRVVVGDTRNGVDLSPYLEEMTIVCLTTLKAPIWVIRNAAIQLFGAILPRIAGQRNATPEIGVRHSFEEVFLKMPGILNHMILTMKQATSQSQASVQHADLVPLLEILVNLKLCSTIILDESLKEKLFDIRILVENLFNSDLFAIRELASKAFLALHSPEEIHQKVNSVLDNVIGYTSHGEHLQGENHVHGYLLMLKQVYDIYPQFQPIISKSDITLQQSLKVSLLSQTLLFHMKMLKTDMSLDIFFHHIIHVLDILQHKRYLSMGYEQWLRAVFFVILKYFDHAEVLRKCLSCSHSIVLLACLEELSETEESVCSELLPCLKYYLEQNDDTMINRIMQTFIRLCKPGYKINCDDFIEKYFDGLADLDYYHFQGTNVHFLGILVAYSGYRINETLEIILETSNIIKYNNNIRLNSAYSMLNLSRILNKFDACKKLIWEILVDLIQDEEVDIRCIGSECFVNIFQVKINYGPEMATNALFDPDIVSNYLSTQEFIDLIWSKLEIVSFETGISEQTLNPFDQGIINSYEEEVKIVSLAGEALKKLIQKNVCICEKYFLNEKFQKYFDTYLIDVLKNCENNSNKFFVNADDYVSKLRCHYLLCVYHCMNKSVENKIEDCAKNLQKFLKL